MFPGLKAFGWCNSTDQWLWTNIPVTRRLQITALFVYKIKSNIYVTLRNDAARNGLTGRSIYFSAEKGKWLLFKSLDKM